MTAHELRIRAHERRIDDWFARMAPAVNCPCGGRRFKERRRLRCFRCGSQCPVPRDYEDNFHERRLRAV